MKRTRLLNSELCYEISRLGHTASITLCDAGLPIPSGVKRIDLAIEDGYPTFLRTLDAILSELKVEEIVIASEMHDRNQLLFEQMPLSWSTKGMHRSLVTLTKKVPSDFSSTKMDLPVRSRNWNLGAVVPFPSVPRRFPG